MTSSIGNIFRVTGPLCAGNSLVTGELPSQKASNAELWYFFLIYAWTNDPANNRDTDELRRHRAHYDVTVMLLDIWSYLIKLYWHFTEYESTERQLCIINSLRPGDSIHESANWAIIGRLFDDKPISELIMICCHVDIFPRNLNQNINIWGREMHWKLPSAKRWPFCFGLVTHTNNNNNITHINQMKQLLEVVQLKRIITTVKSLI